jgi:hypothetical protein
MFQEMDSAANPECMIVGALKMAAGKIEENQ